MDHHSNRHVRATVICFGESMGHLILLFSYAVTLPTHGHAIRVETRQRQRENKS